MSVIGLGLARLLISCPGRQNGRSQHYVQASTRAVAIFEGTELWHRIIGLFVLCLVQAFSIHAQCFATTPASLACAVIRRLYACTEPSKCSIVPLSHTHKLLHTFCSIVTS